VISSLVGPAALMVLLQGLWAGPFLMHDGHRDDASNWIDLHATGGDVAILPAPVHIPLAMAPLGPAVRLPLRARSRD
jgi:hypothetical protein